MAHRGRLNVLVNNIGKKLETIFQEFEGISQPFSYHGSGDVKYHLGSKGNYISSNNNTIPIILAPNPSHLELVDPVVEGMARALDNQANDNFHNITLPILIHGDSAFAGQGIVAETLNLSQLDGYSTGGTIHIIINNQIGFTTTSIEARSTIYATDIAKMIQVPILHVNGNDPEAVCKAAEFAFEYRQKFHSDVVIDILSYRKYGHNESDEPSYTQPLLYKKIREMQPVSKIYSEFLIKNKIISEEDIITIIRNIQQKLYEAFNNRNEIKTLSDTISKFETINIFQNIKTSVDESSIVKIANAITSYPSYFNIHPKIKSLLNKRKEMIAGDKTAIDWAMAEAAMALGFYISISGIVTFRNADRLRDVTRRLPADRLLIETDSPYLAPIPHRGQENQPAYVRDVAEYVAWLRNTSVEEIARLTSENFFRLFPLAKP
jgi:2-oxoglutarate dehydrogenase E1 component